MTDLMLKHLAIDRDGHTAHISPVHLHPFARMVNLSKVQFLRLALRTQPPDLTLKCPELTVRVQSRMPQLKQPQQMC